MIRAVDNSAHRIYNLKFVESNLCLRYVARFNLDSPGNGASLGKERMLSSRASLIASNHPSVVTRLCVSPLPEWFISFLGARAAPRVSAIRMGREIEPSVLEDRREEYALSLRRS